MLEVILFYVVAFYGTIFLLIHCFGWEIDRVEDLLTRKLVLLFLPAIFIFMTFYFSVKVLKMRK